MLFVVYSNEAEANPVPFQLSLTRNNLEVNVLRGSKSHVKSNLPGINK